LKIFVTGASGFIGGYVVKQLATNASYTVIATGRSASTAFEAYPNVTYLQADLTNQIAEISCDICIHCAGLADDHASQVEFDRQNIHATMNLLSALQGCKTLIYLSSSSVYDFHDEQIKEEHHASLHSNLSYYGLSKLKAENLLKNTKAISSLYILRPRAVYGPGDRILLPRILKMIRKHFIIAPGSLRVQTSLTHVHNLYEAITKCFVQSANGLHIYNIADEPVYLLKEVVGELAYRKYGHKKFIHIPISIVRTLAYLSKLFNWKSGLSKQSIDYISQHSLLSIEHAKKQLNYKGKANFKDNINDLDLNNTTLNPKQ
jgi:2-alkyl-3-oxoalkanoate reductase